MKENKFPIIVLGVLLLISLIFYLKKSSDENREDVMQNYVMYSERMVINNIKNKLKYLANNCSSKIMQDASVIELQKQVIQEIFASFEELSNKYQEYDKLFMREGILSYGPIKNTIILRFLNPDLIVSNMMLTDKLNVDKLNNQTYIDKLDAVTKLVNDITSKVLVSTVINPAEMLTNATNKVNEIKSQYIESIMKTFNDVNETNRKISKNLLNLDLSKYTVYMKVNFSNIKSYNKSKYGLNMSDFIDWTIEGKEGTDITMSYPYIVDMNNGDIIDPLDMSIKDSLNNSLNVLFEEKNEVILSKIIKDIK
jgi:hypothetical protein